MAVDAGSDLTGPTILRQSFAEDDLLPGIAWGADVSDILTRDGQGALEGAPARWNRSRICPLSPDIRPPVILWPSPYRLVSATVAPEDE